MSRRVFCGVRAFVAAVTVFAGAVWVQPAVAQTTVVLDAPDSEVVDTTIRAGSYANQNHNGDSLITRASDNLEYVRRALLKFDTHNTIPAGATIQSATLTVTVEHSDPQTRTVSVYRVASSWDEGSATWKSRRSGQSWGTSGGDLAAKYASTSVGTSGGARVNFDVTKLVQEVVKGNYGSRYTRVALTDDGASSGDSYKEYYRSESSDASVRPKLTVVWGGSSTSSSGSTSGSTSSGSTSTSGTALKVLTWNIHRGIGTDGRTDLDRIAMWIAKANPDIATLNEVNSASQASTIVSRLEARTGANWSHYYDDRGNAVVTRRSIASKSLCVVNSGVGRKATHVGIVVNGRQINVWSAHLDVNSSSVRTSETKVLQNCERSWPQAWIAAGDFNMQAGSAEYNSMASGHFDAWVEAKRLGTAVNYSGNCDGCTRNSRIDYVFWSRSASFLALKSAQMIDTRDAYGHMAADHKPLLVTYTVK
jgi:endonuclease/exonuclease/phosphatase family metal-dependent hydrolase